MLNYLKQGSLIRRHYHGVYNDIFALFKSMYKVETALSNVLEREDPEERTDSIFNQMDINCDDRLSLEEFIQGVKKDPHIIKIMEIP